MPEALSTHRSRASRRDHPQGSSSQLCCSVVPLKTLQAALAYGVRLTRALFRKRQLKRTSPSTRPSLRQAETTSPVAWFEAEQRHVFVVHENQRDGSPDLRARVITQEPRGYPEPLDDRNVSGAFSLASCFTCKLHISESGPAWTRTRDLFLIREARRFAGGFQSLQKSCK